MFDIFFYVFVAHNVDPTIRAFTLRFDKLV